MLHQVRVTDAFNASLIPGELRKNMKTQNIQQLAHEVSEKKRYLSELVGPVLDAISRECEPVFNETDRLDECLFKAVGQLPSCKMMYVTDTCYRQLSSNVSARGIEPEYRGQALSQRPYLQSTLPLKGLVLSNLYLDVHTSQHIISLLQAVQKEGELQGFLIADFNLDEMPLPNGVTQMMSSWHQFKGDPAIRGGLFHQQRSHSRLDVHIDKVHEAVQDLLTQYGVFHFKLHYSSSRVTLWLYDSPHHYRLHDTDELVDESIFSQYANREYPQEACIGSRSLDAVLKQFKGLRFADENIYLRSGSVNIINGMVGLNFSCDGSHYIPVQEFIDNEMEYWLGNFKTA